jgi:hypothetical protein
LLGVAVGREAKVPPKGSSFLLTDPYPLPHILYLFLLP